MSPKVEDFLASQGTDSSEVLIRELLALEMDYRRRRGDAPMAEELSRRFPHCQTLLVGIHDSRILDARSSAHDSAPATAPQEIGKLQLLHEVGRGSSDRDRLVDHDHARWQLEILTPSDRILHD